MSYKIVLVDDDRNILTSVSMALEAEGYVIKAFNDGEAGLKGILDEKPDLAVLDIKMPRMDGVTATREIRALAGPAGRVPIIAGCSMEELGTACGIDVGAAAITILK